MFVNYHVPDAILGIGDVAEVLALKNFYSSINYFRKEIIKLL